MREFFQGWRRKAGCVTLVMAVALTVGWIRSLSLADYLAFPIQQRQFYVASFGGILFLSRPAIRPAGWSCEVGIDTNEVWIEVDQDHILPAVRYDDGGWIVPYWIFALPLALLSAYLILVPSRKPRPTESQPHV